MMNIHICMCMLCMYRAGCSETLAVSSGHASSSESRVYIKNTCFVGSQVGIFSMFIIPILTITQSLYQKKVYVSVHLSCFVFIEIFIISGFSGHILSVNGKLLPGEGYLAGSEY